MDINQILKESGLTQRELAERIVAEFGGTLHQTAVSKWADRGIPLDRKHQISVVTGISLRKVAPELFTRRGPRGELRP